MAYEYLVGEDRYKQTHLSHKMLYCDKNQRNGVLGWDEV